MAGADPISLSTQSAITEPYTDFSATAVTTLGITRTYTSADASIQADAPSGIFGRGWHHDWEASLTCDAESCTVTRGLTQGLEFMPVGTAPSLDETEELTIYEAFSGPGYRTDHPYVLVQRQDGEWTLFLDDGIELWFGQVCDSSCEGADTCIDARIGGRARLVRVVDRAGNAVHISYDRAMGILLGLSDGLGHTLELRSSSACSEGLARELWYDGSHLVTYDYSGADLASATDADQKTLRAYEYYGSTGLMWGVKNESGDLVAQFSYDDQWRATGVVDASSSVLVSYSSGNRIEVTEYYGDSRASTGTRTLTSDNQIASVGSGSSCGPAQTYTWVNGHPECVTDSLGHVTYTKTDSHGRVTRRAEYSTSLYSCPPPPAQLYAREQRFTYGLSKPVAVGRAVAMNHATETLRSSAVSSHPGYVIEAVDYDPTPKSVDPLGYVCQAAPLPAGSAPCRTTIAGYASDPISSTHTAHRYAEFFSYDARGRLTKRIGPITIEPLLADESMPIEERTYWPDAESLARRGRLHEVKRYPAPDASALVTTYDYDAFGVFQVRGPRGDLTTFVKDGRGRTTFVIRNDGRSEETRYYDGSTPRLRLLPSGAAVRLSHDSMGRTQSIERLHGDPEAAGTTPIRGWSEHFVRDEAGNVVHTERRDASGQVTWKQDREHDVQRRLVSDVNPSYPGEKRSWHYDASGFLEATVDEEGRSTVFTPDRLNRVDTITRTGTDSSGASVSSRVAKYAYTPFSDTIAAVTDGKTNVYGGQPTSYWYDDFGRLTRMHTVTFSYAAGEQRFVYDARGNIVSKSGDDGRLTQGFEWDGLGRLVSVRAANTRTDESITYTYVYDERGHTGHLTTVIEPGRTVMYDYDTMGRLATETASESGVSAALVTSYEYDADGDLAVIHYPTGLSVRYERDPATKDIVKVREDPAGAVYADAVAHVPGGPVSGLAFGNGLALTQWFDYRYAPSTIQSGPLSLTYVRSPSGNVKSIHDGETLWMFTYDLLDRLLTQIPGHTGEATYHFDYYLDRVTTAKSPDAAGALKNRYAFAYDGHGAVSAIGQYDANGWNVTKALCLKRDPLGRLVGVSNMYPGWIVWGNTAFASCTLGVTTDIARFTYDHRNRRIARWLASTNESTYFAHAPDGSVVSEMALTSDPSAPWSPTRDYVWLDGRPIAQIEHSAAGQSHIYSLHVDHVGLPRAMTNANGHTVWSARQARPYGDVSEDSAIDPLSGRAVVTNLRLPGQYDERLLGSLGLQGPYYNWNRWYLPGVGRYLELDPIALHGGFNGPYGPDWYNYANGNPLRYTDPWGLETYHCRKPLDALGGDGTRSGPDVPGNPFYHQYSCVVRNGKVQCGGQDRSGSAWGSPGKPSNDKFNPDTCKQAQPDNDCYEKCLAEEWAKPRPWYGIPFGTDCQEYDDNVNETCRKRCNIK